jgi:hypothetical protein
MDKDNGIGTFCHLFWMKVGLNERPEKTNGSWVGLPRKLKELDRDECAKA